MLFPRTPSCLSEYRLDLHLVGGETSAEGEETRLHLARCPRCSQRFEACLSAKQAWQAHTEPLPLTKEEPETQVPLSKDGPFPKPLLWKRRGWGWIFWPLAFLFPSSFTATSEERPKREPILRGWLSWGSLAVAASLPFFLITPLLWRGSAREDGGLGSEPMLYRGDRPPPLFLAALRREGQIRLLPSQALVLPKDRLRLAYQWEIEGERFLYVIHRDRTDKMTPLYPEDPMQPSLRLQTRLRVEPLPGSLEVEDDTRDREEIWGCFSTKPLQYSEVTKALPPLLSGWKMAPRPPCLYLLRILLRRESP